MSHPVVTFYTREKVSTIVHVLKMERHDGFPVVQQDDENVWALFCTFYILCVICKDVPDFYPGSVGSGIRPFNGKSDRIQFRQYFWPDFWIWWIAALLPCIRTDYKVFAYTYSLAYAQVIAVLFGLYRRKPRFSNFFQYLASAVISFEDVTSALAGFRECLGLHD